MTAEVKVLVEEVPETLVVPVQAVAERSGQHFTYVLAPGGVVDRREVSIGKSNDKFVEIKQGLTEGEKVALNARARMTSEIKGAETIGKGPSEPLEAPVKPQGVATTQSRSGTGRQVQGP
jgi:hypothetical protein